ncbi:ribonuclease E/G [Blattabacterium cuenoti]|uniref:ribonuclease E/G n=1 Tax=Blattabacterium cuenoti TaxID=1653831 RepID=UPI00163BFB1C|nr:ribonuclease E/G [Blattabacterium cuenoti]
MHDNKYKELILNVEEKEIGIAILKRGILYEIHKELFNSRFSLGDIYLGTVYKILPALNAIILDIGHDKGGFLHYNDINLEFVKNYCLINKNDEDFVDEGNDEDFVDEGNDEDFVDEGNDEDFVDEGNDEDFVDEGNDEENYLLYRSFFIKNYKEKEIKKIFSIGQKVLVQISKESGSNKGPKLTTKICFIGKNIIFTPFSNKKYISKKIKNTNERKRFIYYMNNFNQTGFIIRTSAMFQTYISLNNELLFLIKKWKNILVNIKFKKYPYKIFGELNKIYSLLRNNDFKQIYCNSRKLCKEIYYYISIIFPSKKNIIKYYKGCIPIFEKYGVEQQIQLFLGKIIPIDNGGYLIIEHTEALHSIDINSGIIDNMEKHFSILDKIENIFKINLLAIIEIVRQIILRNIGGIIIVDFIDMPFCFQKKKLYKYLKKKMEIDKAKHKVFPPNELGLTIITRKKIRFELKIKRNKKIYYII